MPPITFALILLNVLIYALGIFTGPDIVRTFGLWPPGSGGAFHYWQLITYSFLHGSLLHLGFNMAAVWMFGAELEKRWNDLRYLLTYLLSVAVAAMTQITVSGYFLHATGPVIGASGGVFGLLLAYALYFPNRVISIIFLPFIQIPARTFVLGYGAAGTVSGIHQHRAQASPTSPTSAGCSAAGWECSISADAGFSASAKRKFKTQVQEFRLKPRAQLTGPQT